jgi:hypothetical protein
MSYSGDFEVCRLLCESIDRFVPAAMTHVLFVPERDFGLFAPLANARRRLMSQEALLPRGFWKLPLPSPEWRRRLFLPRRNVYLTPYSLPVRGWIAQQIMKLAAPEVVDSEIVVHVDSDNAFIRPLTSSHLWQDGRARLYRNPSMVPLASHRTWHAAAGRLLGLPPADFHGAEYIDPLVVWRRPVLQGLLRKLTEQAGTDWRVALARTPHFAEYVLYGVYADKVLGLDRAGLFATGQSLCLSRWSEAFTGGEDEVSFIAGLQPHHVTCLIQSTIAMPPAARRRLFESVAAAAQT